jgi:hypothetical protein
MAEVMDAMKVWTDSDFIKQTQEAKPDEPKKKT